MNTHHKNRTDSRQGFTIIEVVLVLAIAGLIFLMVFIALPALQRGQRDTQRKDDLSRVNTQISNFSSSNRGAIPKAATGVGGIIGTDSFVVKYLKGSGDQAGSEYVDPSVGADPTTNLGYQFTDTSADPAKNQINYQTNVICGTDGSAVTNDGSTSATQRNYVLRILLENQTAPYCIDNR
jgi:prepilin-type N-terminal cleavage/methylation domain-containing protein